MASANKRTTCALATVAIIFIIVIIILCLVPDPCRRHDPRPECKESVIHPKTASPSTTVRTTSTTRKQTEPPTTSPHPPTSTSTFSPSTSSVSSTLSTEESLLDQDTYGTDSSTYSTESSHFTDEDGTTTPVSDLTETTIVVEAFDNETTTTDSINMTTEFGGDSTTEMYTLDYNVTGGDSTTEMYILDYNITTTDVISTTLELNTTANVTEMPTTTEIEMSTGVSTTETAETTTETELSTTMTAGVTNATESSTTTVESTTETHLYPVSLQPPAAPKGVCDTEVCTEVARRMLDMMDPGDVDPCDDFYQYSCGGVLDDPFLKPEDPQVFADKIIKEALTYGPKDDEDLEDLFVTYDSCLNYSNYNEDERLTSAREVFEELGYQFSPLPGSDFDVGEALLKMMKRHFTPFFDINIDIPQDEESISLKMVLPTAASAFTNERAKDICVAEYKAKEEGAKYNKLAFDVNSQYEDYVNCMKYGQGLQERMKHIQRSIDHLGLLDDKGNAISEDVKNQATGALKKMLEDLAEETPSISEIRKALVNKKYEEFSLVDIDDKLVLGHLPFKMSKFIQDLLGIPIKEPHHVKIQVYSKDVFVKLFEIISDTYERQKPLMQNIMMLLWVEHIYDDLINPVGAPPGSLDYCFGTVTNLMDDYVSYLYLKTMPERDRLESQMKRMIDLTVELMKSQVKISGLGFSDEFIEELNEMKGEFATLDEPKTVLRENKNNIEISKVGNNFTENYIILTKNYRDRLYYIFKEQLTNYRTLWSFLQFPYRHTAVTSYGLNTFLIPHGAMSPPYYYEDAPSYINYAGVGHMIAQELLHSFNFKGMKFTGEANLAISRDSMLTKNHDCLSQQLSSISSIRSSKGLKYNVKLQQSLHLDELLADVAAPNLAWNAYNKDLTYNSTPPAVTTATPIPSYSGIVTRRRRSTESMSTASRNESHVLVTNDLSLHEKHLVHWEDKTIQQIYFIKTAQNQCSSASGLDVLEVMENENLPPKLRVNLGLGNNKMFMKAFNCDRKSKPKMKPQAGVCFHNPTGHD